MAPKRPAKATKSPQPSSPKKAKTSKATTKAEEPLAPTQLTSKSKDAIAAAPATKPDLDLSTSVEQPKSEQAADIIEGASKASVAVKQPQRSNTKKAAGAAAAAKVSKSQDVAEGPADGVEPNVTNSGGQEDGKGRVGGSAARGKGRKGKGTAGAATEADAKKEAKSQEQSEDPTGPRYYLMKSEPHEFSIDDLAAKPNGTGEWDGVRNAQARNIMKGMKVGEQLFFYHSSCKVPGIVGLCRVAREAYPDHTAWDPKSKNYDERSTKETPKWHMVDVEFVRQTKRMITLEELKQFKDAELAGMVLLNRSRLSVQPVTQRQWEFIMSLEDKQVSDSA